MYTQALQKDFTVFEGQKITVIVSWNVGMAGIMDFYGLELPLIRFYFKASYPTVHENNVRCYPKFQIECHCVPIGSFLYLASNWIIKS